MCALVILVSFGCKFKFLNSKTKSTSNPQIPKGALKKLSGAFGFYHSTKTGGIYPVHFNFTLNVSQNQQTGTLFTQVQSDGHLEKDSKGKTKVKDDNNLALKAKATEREGLVFSSQASSGSQAFELEVTQGELGWQVKKIKYFGQEAQVEGSWASALWEQSFDSQTRE
jgi:hypothetical protein